MNGWQLVTVFLPAFLLVAGAIIKLYGNVSKLQERWDFFYEIFKEHLIRIAHSPHTEKLDALLDRYKHNGMFSRAEVREMIDLLSAVTKEEDRTKSERASAETLLKMICRDYGITLTEI
jgi:hypothetical protein